MKLFYRDDMDAYFVTYPTGIATIIWPKMYNRLTIDRYSYILTMEYNISEYENTLLKVAQIRKLGEDHYLCLLLKQY